MLWAILSSVKLEISTFLFNVIFKKAHSHTAKRYRALKTSIRTFVISIGCVQSYVNIFQTNIFKMPIITFKKKLLNEVKMYLMNSSIYFSVKGREFFVFLYLHFFQCWKENWKFRSKLNVTNTNNSWYCIRLVIWLSSSKCLRLTINSALLLYERNKAQQSVELDSEFLH